MKKSVIVLSAALCTALLLGLIVLVNGISVLNHENRLRQLIVAKQVDNKSEMDAMWKTIAQSAEVTTAQKDALREIFNGYAQARTPQAANDGSLARWIHEAVPNVDTSTFNNLQNIITSKRDGFARRQKELLDFSREHNTLLGNVYSGLICQTFGRRSIPVTIVTSTRTDGAFESGKDDDVKLFNK